MKKDRGLRKRKPRVRVPRSETYKQDFILQGSNPKKQFMALMTRYGVRGYRLGILLPGTSKVAPDFFFPQKRLAIFVNPIGVSESEARELEQLGLFLICVLDQEPSQEWLEAIAMIKDDDVKNLKPVHPSIFSRVVPLEAALKRVAR